MSAACPAPARIDDLAAPTYGGDARQLKDVLDAHGATRSLTPEAMCAEAEARTGLRHWGDAAYVHRLEVLCRGLRDEANLAPFGVAFTWESLVQMLANRLLLEDLVRRHPEIEQVPVERPIVVCGLPRTGTTHLHNLLSADPALRHLPYWESLEPVLAAGEEPSDGEPDPRRARCQAALDVMAQFMPLFERMHEMTVDHAHEEIQLLALDVAGMFHETTSLMPSWRDDYKAADQTASYAYLKRVLQALTWLRGGERWVLKSPQHMEQFRPLLAVFPDAVFVVTHRDPVAVTASLVTMLGYTARMRTDRPDPHAIGRYWAERAGDLLEGCVADHHLLPPERTVDVRFDDFMSDELAVVERIYAAAGQPLDDRARDGMDAFVAAHPRGRLGTIEYDLGAFGLDAGDIRRRLGHYRERFDLRDEGVR